MTVSRWKTTACFVVVENGKLQGVTAAVRHVEQSIMNEVVSRRVVDCNMLKRNTRIWIYHHRPDPN